MDISYDVYNEDLSVFKDNGPEIYNVVKMDILYEEDTKEYYVVTYKPIINIFDKKKIISNVVHSLKSLFQKTKPSDFVVKTCSILVTLNNKNFEQFVQVKYLKKK